MNIELNAFDLIEITLFAERQHAVKVATGAKTKKYDKNKSEFELHYLGAMAEYAVSKTYNVPMDRTVHVGGDNGTDVVINGYTCEIKAHSYTGRNFELFIDSMRVFKADVLVSVQIASPTQVRIVGCISKAKFAKVHKVKNYGYGDRIYVNESELMPLDVLLKNGSPQSVGVPDNEFGGML